MLGEMFFWGAGKVMRGEERDGKRGNARKSDENINLKGLEEGLREKVMRV